MPEPVILYTWSESKNRKLKEERNISFRQVILHLAQGDLVDVVEHPNQVKYPRQRILLIKMRDFVWLVPFVENGGEIFLKTIIPSRKATAQYLR